MARLSVVVLAVAGSWAAFPAASQGTAATPGTAPSMAAPGMATPGPVPGAAPGGSVGSTVGGAPAARAASTSSVGRTKPPGAAADGTRPDLEVKSRQIDRRIRTGICSGC